MGLSLQKILIVDDDEGIADLLVRKFTKDGFEVVRTYDAPSTLKKVYEESYIPDLAIFDIRLGHKAEGMDLLKTFRSKKITQDVPVIIMTAMDNNGYKWDLESFAGGAIDFVTKPFDYASMIARAKLRLKQHRASQILDEVASGHHALEVGAVKVIALTRDVLVDEEPTQESFSPEEFDCLVLLMKSAGAVLSRRRLIDQLKHHKSIISPRMIDQLVARIRKKLGPAGPAHIRTERSLGYCFEKPA